jgi:hypothetical protein
MAPREGTMLVTILVTFLVTTALYAAAGAWGTTRVIRHLQTDRAAVQAVIDHVVTPLLGRKADPAKKAEGP